MMSFHVDRHWSSRMAPNAIIAPERHWLHLRPDFMIKEVQWLAPCGCNQPFRSHGCGGSISCGTVALHLRAELLELLIRSALRKLLEALLQRAARLQEEFSRKLIFGSTVFSNFRLQLSHSDANFQVLKYELEAIT